MCYKKAPHFDEIFNIYEQVIDNSEILLDLNISLIEEIAHYLEIKNERQKLSEILPAFGQKIDLIVDICKALSATSYLSGTGGGKDYNDEDKLKSNNINLIYSDFKHPEYRQLWHDFIPNLSILDLLFNFGKESIDILFNNK